MKRLHWVVLAVCLTCAHWAAADGTIDFDEVKPILMQKPFFGNTLFSLFDFDKTAEAVRIGTESNPALAGKRVGPYRLYARKKDQTGAFDTAIVVNTALTFLDANGRITKQLSRAKTINEAFENIEIEEVK